MTGLQAFVLWTNAAELRQTLGSSRPRCSSVLCEVVLKFCSGSSISVSPYKAPRNLQTSEPTKTSFRVSWDPAPGDVKGYKVTFHPTGNDVDLGELLVGPYDSTVVLEELR